MHHPEGFSSTSNKQDRQAIVHLLYSKAVDLRLCLMLSKLDFDVKPVSNLKRLLDLYTADRHALIVIDVGPGLDDGIAIVERLASRLTEAHIIPISTNGSIDFFRRCFKAGAMDVLDKAFDDERIEEAFRALQRAEGFQPSALSSTRRRRVRFAALTQRERQVFRYLIDGLTSREIGELLGLSPRTVEIHRARVHEKLCARNAAQLASEYTPFIASCETPFLPARKMESSTIQTLRGPADLT